MATDILVKCDMSLEIVKDPGLAGSPITQEDFSTEFVKDISEYNESQCGRFKIADGATDQALAFGTVALAGLVILEPEADLTVKLVNGVGAPQAIVLKGGKTSVLFMALTGILVSNASGTAIKGRYAVAGD